MEHKHARVLAAFAALALTTGVFDPAVEAQRSQKKTPRAPQKKAPEPAKTPPYVVPADPSTPAGEAVMIASDAYKNGNTKAVQAYANKPQPKPALAVYTDNGSADWVKTYVVALRQSADQLEDTNAASIPHFGKVTSLEDVNNVYENAGELNQARTAAAQDIIDRLNGLAPEFNKFLNEALVKEKAAKKPDNKHISADELEKLLKENLFYNKDNATDTFSTESNLLPSQTEDQAWIAAEQLRVLAKYLEALLQVKDGTPGMLDKNTATKFLKDFSAKKGAQIGGTHFLTPERATKIEPEVGAIQAIIERFQDYQHRFGSPQAAPASAPAVVGKPDGQGTSYVVLPFDLGGRPVAGFVSNPRVD